MFTLVCVTSVAYRHDVKRKNLTFWLFRKKKSDLMSNNMNMNNDTCNQKFDT